MHESNVIVDVLQRVQNNAIYIAGNWYKLSRRSKLPSVPLTNLIGTTVKVKVSGKWVDELQPVKRSKDIAYLQEYIDDRLNQLQENLTENLTKNLLKEIEPRLKELEDKLSELTDLLSKYLLEDIKYGK